MSKIVRDALEMAEACKPRREEMYADLLPFEMERSEFNYLSFIKGTADEKLRHERADDMQGFQGRSDLDEQHAECKALETQIEEGVLAAKASPCYGWGHLWRPTPEVPPKRKFTSAEEAAAWYQMEDRAKRVVTVKLDPDPICESACAQFRGMRDNILADDRPAYRTYAAQKLTEELYREFHED